MQRWKIAFGLPIFKVYSLIGFTLLISVLLIFPTFFQYIEQRPGYVLNDIVLKSLPSVNLSIPIFAIIWAMAILTIVRCFQQPFIFMMFLWGFVLLSISRIITITLVPLAAPIGLIELTDPISNTFYGSGGFITKDLFYSGHTATQFLMFLCLQKKWDKIFTATSTLLIGVMVLIQHVHYSIDVLAAIPLTYFVFTIAKKIVQPVLKSLANLKV